MHELGQPSTPFGVANTNLDDTIIINENRQENANYHTLFSVNADKTKLKLLQSKLLVLQDRHERDELYSSARMKLWYRAIPQYTCISLLVTVYLHVVFCMNVVKLLKIARYSLSPVNMLLCWRGSARKSIWSLQWMSIWVNFAVNRQCIVSSIPKLRLLLKVQRRQ